MYQVRIAVVHETRRKSRPMNSFCVEMTRMFTGRESEPTYSICLRLKGWHRIRAALAAQKPAGRALPVRTPQPLRFLHLPQDPVDNHGLDSPAGNERETAPPPSVQDQPDDGKNYCHPEEQQHDTEERDVGDMKRERGTPTLGAMFLVGRDALSSMVRPEEGDDMMHDHNRA
ncbi:hypothetical protein PUNSTDRAFT_45950 [Punctularia strigosozonata HHB-11173 SS5]|uniref:uncharacterized protein n=1 Tax=Punctularia strigosozonata (strain HHB-11173) TaxID=741275 RepID=UPI0004417C55|nr:uncharacterized protein PUNSTDRAFT_45950 [Punctularia strigosozonata HHB-11173 SS5]EIN06446.1 hypothetical protein PUNSTDRAFT_45950 [Punctularia strigosozonata HHB-11173 SS5]